MRPRLAVGCALVLAAATPGFAQDWFEPNPSLARLSADDAYARTSALSLRTARIDAAVAIRLDDAGRVLVAGGLRIARLDADGRLDPTFGVAGVAKLPVRDGWLSGLEIDAAGRIVVTGAFYDTYSYQLPDYAGPVYRAARLLADGSLDPAFSGDGLLEIDRAAGVYLLGPVHASGSDGAMLAVAEKDGPPQPPTGYSRPLFGVVRIAADGTIDATYGGGFAQVAPLPDSGDYYDSVGDFAVDSAGRAVVAVRDQSGPRTVLHLDAAGGLDPSWKRNPYWYGYDAYPYWPASQIALDGAGRIVGLDETRLWRGLPDGGTDPAFSGDGVATRYEAAGFPGTTSVLAQLLEYERFDYDFDGSVWGGRDFLAVAAHGDRWVLARLVDFHDAKRRVVAHGIHVQAIDPADPGAIVSTTYRSSDRTFGEVTGLAVAPDGSTAYALGNTFVLRVDLAARKALPLPDLRVKWLGWPHAVDFGGGRHRVTQRVRITNASRTDATAAYGFVGFAPGAYGVPPFPPGSYDIALVVGAKSATAGYSWPFHVRARSSVVKRLKWEGGDTSTNLAGTRLSIKIACELPDANPADNTATSRTISPLYAPR